MAEEIEIKLRIKEENTDVQAKLSGLFEVKTWQVNTLINRYFDTPHLALHQNRIALRIREKNGGWIQTLKTAGKAKDGLHRRGEWEWRLENDELCIDLLEDLDAWPENIEFEALKPVFETNFVRHQAVLHYDGAEIELALDNGFVIVEDQRDPINEIELELLSGDESVLLKASELIKQNIDVEEYDVSKAERGYRLFQQSI